MTYIFYLDDVGLSEEFLQYLGFVSDNGNFGGMEGVLVDDFKCRKFSRKIDWFN